MLERLMRQLLPGSCLLCAQALPPDDPLDLCGHCRAALPWNTTPCPRCAHPGNGALCAACATHPPPFTRALAPLRHESYPRAWVGRLKDHLGLVEGRVLGMLLAEAAAGCYGPGTSRPDFLVPVPLHPGRLARRGHNQAVALAVPVARKLEVPLVRRALARTGGARRQRGLSRRQRLDNPAGRFACRQTWSRSPCVGLVDDVLTTGATAAAVANALLAAGAGEVHVLCATRTPRLAGQT